MDNLIQQKINYMSVAMEEAKAAGEAGEIPVGAVIVKDGEIIARAHNMNRRMNNPLKHAEMLCIGQASHVLQNERLMGCELYVTKEPCSMCAGAIVHARIEKVVIGAEDEKYGACGTVLDVCCNARLNHLPEIEFGIMRKESSELLSGFFKDIRKKKKLL